MFAGKRLGAGVPGLGCLDLTVRDGNTGLGETDSAWPSAADTVAKPKTNASSQAWLFLRRRLAATFV